MTKDEAEKIFNILKTVDGNCPVCACEVFGKFIAEFGYMELGRKIYRKAFNDNLDIDGEDE